MKLLKPTSSRRKLLELFSLDEQSRLFRERAQSSASRLSHDSPNADRFTTRDR